jgi:hypothetical protein
MFLHLQVSQFQFVSANALAPVIGALRAAKIVIPHDELLFTRKTALAARTDFDGQLKAIKIGSPDDGLKAESQRVPVDCSQFADLEANSSESRIRIAQRLPADGLNYSFGDAQLVHTRS